MKARIAVAVAVVLAGAVAVDRAAKGKAESSKCNTRTRDGRNAIVDLGELEFAACIAAQRDYHRGAAK